MTLDTAILTVAAGLRHPFLTELAIGITAFGSAAVALVLIGAAVLHDDRFLAARLFAAVAVGGAVEKLLNVVVARPRPTTVSHIVPATGAAFPSGHATVAFALATVLDDYVDMRAYLFTVAGLVAVSRVYLGVHHPSDVVAGALLGAAAGYAVRRLPLESYYS